MTLITSIPTKTDESLGRPKSDFYPPSDLNKQVPAAEFERIKDAVINLHEAVGVYSGTTAGSLQQKAANLTRRIWRCDLDSAVPNVLYDDTGSNVSLDGPMVVGARANALRVIGDTGGSDGLVAIAPLVSALSTTMDGSVAYAIRYVMRFTVSAQILGPLVGRSNFQIGVGIGGFNTTGSPQACIAGVGVLGASSDYQVHRVSGGTRTSSTPLGTAGGIGVGAAAFGDPAANGGKGLTIEAEINLIRAGTPPSASAPVFDMRVTAYSQNGGGSFWHSSEGHVAMNGSLPSNFNNAFRFNYPSILIRTGGGGPWELAIADWEIHRHPYDEL